MRREVSNEEKKIEVINVPNVPVLPTIQEDRPVTVIYNPMTNYRAMQWEISNLHLNPLGSNIASEKQTGRKFQTC